MVESKTVPKDSAFAIHRPRPSSDGRGNELIELGIKPGTFLNVSDTLFIPGGDGRGQRTSVVLGRNDRADVVVGATVYPDRPGVFPLDHISPLHARVEVYPGGVNVVDLQSATGLWFRRDREGLWCPVTQTGPLGDGDQIMLGQEPYGVQLIFHPTRPESGSPCGGGWSFTRVK